MPTLTTRLGTYGKGSALSHAEMDANWKRPVTAVTSTPVTLTEAHNRNIIECGAGSGILALTAAATLAAIDTEDWFVDIVNTTSSAITIDPNGSETIDGATTYTLASGSSVRVFLDAAKTGFRTLQLATKLFTSTMAFLSEVDNGNSGSADTIDWTLGNKQKSTLTDNATFTFTAPPGPCNLVLKLIQDGTGGRNPVWPASVLWAGGAEPSWSTAGGAIDIVTFYYDGTNYFGAALRGFA